MRKKHRLQTQYHVFQSFTYSILYRGAVRCVVVVDVVNLAVFVDVVVVVVDVVVVHVSRHL